MSWRSATRLTHQCCVNVVLNAFSHLSQAHHVNSFHRQGKKSSDIAESSFVFLPLPIIWHKDNQPAFFERRIPGH